MAKKTRQAIKKEGTRARVPFGGQRLKLELSEADRKGFEDRKVVPRWVVEKEGRIESALAGGYQFVKPEHATSLGQGALHGGNTDEGGKVSKVVNPNVEGLPKRAFLMEIPLKYWKEDQKLKEERNQQVDEALRIGQAGGTSVENQYVPGGRKSAVTYSH